MGLSLGKGQAPQPKDDAPSAFEEGGRGASGGAGASSKADRHEVHHAKVLRYNRKKKAMAACGDLHGDLLDCFQKASMFTFKPICQDENNAFWECYKRERGVDLEGQREMSFKQMYEDAKVYFREQWGTEGAKDQD